MSDKHVKALAKVAKPMKEFLGNIAGPNSEKWILAFGRFVRMENPWPKLVVRWTVTLGAYKTPKDYLRAIRSSRRFKVSDVAVEMLRRVKCSKKKVKINLTLASVAEIGLPEGGTTDELHAAILAQGGKLCPAEVGPAFRLLLKNQPNTEWWWLAMETIPDARDSPRVFLVTNDCNEQALRGGRGRPGFFWRPDRMIVFVVPE